jgi:hypothetical protein
MFGGAAAQRPTVAANTRRNRRATHHPDRMSGAHARDLHAGTIAPAHGRQDTFTMDPSLARNIAHYSHVRRRNRHGDPIVEHVARVVAAVPAEAQTVAWLHDVLEQSETTAAELHDQGLTPVEQAALEMLTRRSDESYELYVLRLAYAPGVAGRLARTVKLADLDDHIAHAWVPGAPPYEWARRRIAVAADRAGDNAGEAAA